MRTTQLCSPEVLSVVSSRSQAYGPPLEFYRQLAGVWTMMIERDSGLNMFPPLSTKLVCLMMAALKVLRATGGFRDDNYIDAVAFLSFAQEAHAVSLNPVTKKS